MTSACAASQSSRPSAESLAGFTSVRKSLRHAAMSSSQGKAGMSSGRACGSVKTGSGSRNIGMPIIQNDRRSASQGHCSFHCSYPKGVWLAPCECSEREMRLICAQEKGARGAQDLRFTGVGDRPAGRPPRGATADRPGHLSPNTAAQRRYCRTGNGCGYRRATDEPVHTSESLDGPTSARAGADRCARGPRQPFQLSRATGARRRHDARGATHNPATALSDGHLQNPDGAIRVFA